MQSVLMASLAPLLWASGSKPAAADELEWILPMDEMEDLIEEFITPPLSGKVRCMPLQVRGRLHTLQLGSTSFGATLKSGVAEAVHERNVEYSACFVLLFMCMISPVLTRMQCVPS